MFSAPPWSRENASPSMASPATAGPPELPGLMAASIWMRSPATGALYWANSMRETMPLVMDRLLPPCG